ncbi:hypothetical protein F4X86_01400 [Candidatus Saccharibacteria bacterium]|nr:hypothetical protein [Candidatus Saccharibacteria bacterium]
MSIKEIYAKVGLQIQVGDSNCGPTSLLNVLRLKGDGRFDEDELAERCGTKAGTGTENEDMVRVAGDIGLEIAETKYDAGLGDLRRHLDGGCHVLINYTPTAHSNGHYSVAVEYDEKAVYIWDCFYGLLRLDNEAFEKCWHSGQKTTFRWLMAVKA